jgi:hypothetical protein
MAQVFHFGPYYWLGPFETGLPPGGEHSWSWGPNPGFGRSGLIATAHPGLDPITLRGGDRRLTVTMIQSHRTPTPTDAQFIHAFVRNVGSGWVNSYSLWLTVINP